MAHCRHSCSSHALPMQALVQALCKHTINHPVGLYICAGAGVALDIYEGAEAAQVSKQSWMQAFMFTGLPLATNLPTQCVCMHPIATQYRCHWAAVNLITCLKMQLTTKQGAMPEQNKDRQACHNKSCIKAINLILSLHKKCRGCICTRKLKTNQTPIRFF